MQKNLILLFLAAALVAILDSMVATGEVPLALEELGQRPQRPASRPYAAAGGIRDHLEGDCWVAGVTSGHPAVIDATRGMINEDSIAKMKDGGSPMRVLTRDQVQAMWKERQAYLSDLLKDLRK